MGTATRAVTPVSMHLPFTPAAVSEARRELRSWLKEAGVDGDFAYDARLIVSELVGNAVRHAEPLPGDELAVAWEINRRGLQISVTDGGTAERVRSRPRRVPAAPTDTSGRGMAIVETLASRWWTERGRTRTTVHAVVPIDETD